MSKASAAFPYNPSFIEQMDFSPGSMLQLPEFIRIPMYWLYLIVLPALLILAITLFRRIHAHRTGRITYSRKEFLLSAEERLFYSALRDAVGENFEIFPMIHVDDLITPRNPSIVDKTWDLLDMNDEAVIPFVLARKSDLGIACAIQLIQHKGLRSRDKISNESPLKTICQAAGLPLIRMEAGPFYDNEDIRQAVSESVRREPLFITESDGRREPTIDRLERLDID